MKMGEGTVNQSLVDKYYIKILYKLLRQFIRSYSKNQSTQNIFLPL